MHIAAGQAHGHAQLVAGAETRSNINVVKADLTSADEVTAALADATHVIHLGALQVPFCRANPRAGAAVNVEGTINVFEAALANGIEHVVYASSVAVYGPMADPTARIDDHTPFDPRSLYGGYKVANEHAARVYGAELGLPTIGLRPHTLYGPGRDQGLTSQPTQAIRAALAGERYQIEYAARWASSTHQTWRAGSSPQSEPNRRGRRCTTWEGRRHR